METINLIFQQQPIGLFFGGVLLFFIIRELFTWYWKMNRVVNSLENIEESLKKIEDKLTVRSSL